MRSSMKTKIKDLKKACKAFDHHIIEVNTYTNEIVRVRERSAVNDCLRSLIKDGVMIYITGGPDEN